jgi:ABC-type amino acid transport substrate-binding protein
MTMRQASTGNLEWQRLAAACAAALVMASPLVRAQKPAVTTEAPAAAASAATLDRVRGAARIRFGYRADARPFSYKDDSGQAAGYAVALCQKIADAVKSESGLATLAVEWVPVTVSSRFTAVQQGSIDLFCGPDAITLAARRDVAFSIPVFPGGVGALLRADAPVRLREVLSGRPPAPTPIWRANATQILQARDLTVVSGTATETWLTSRARDLDVVAKIAPVNSNDAGVQAVLARRADVFFAERSVLLDAARRNPSPDALVVLDRMFTYSPLAMAFRRGDDDFRLLVDRTLSRLYGSGEIGGLYAKWFGEPDGNTMTFFRWNTLTN